MTSKAKPTKTLKPVTNDHPTRDATYKGVTVQLDLGIADLIEALWRLGINTEYSCEGSSAPGAAAHVAYIAFPWVRDANPFLGLIEMLAPELGVAKLKKWHPPTTRLRGWNWIPRATDLTPVYFNSKHLRRLTEVFTAVAPI